MAPPASREMDPETVEQIRQYCPSSTKDIRACLRCRLIMTRDQFFRMGCPHCRDVLSMQENDGKVVACTTASFQGFVSLMRPGAFLSRFNGLEHRRPGCYALTVHGTIPHHILHESDVEGESDIEVGRRSVRAAGGNISDGEQQYEKSDDEEVPAGQPVALPFVEATQSPASPADAGGPAAVDAVDVVEAAAPAAATAPVPEGAAPAEGGVAPGSPSSEGAFSLGTPEGKGEFTPKPGEGPPAPAHGEESPAAAQSDQHSPKRRRVDVEPILEPEADTEFSAPQL